MSTPLAPQMLRHYGRVQRVLERLDPQGPPWSIVAPGSPEPRGDSIVFPGSFNPPTLAHLAMLRQARIWARRRYGGHWQVYAALSRQIVDKETVERLTLLDRVVLLEHVLSKQVRRAGILLLNRGLYVEQARGIRAAFPQVRRLSFLVGFDKIVQIFDARYYTERDAALRELFAQADLLVAPRGLDGEAQLKELLARSENRPFARHVHALPLDARYRDMSSTSARQGMRLDEVPAEVFDFIRRTRPYAPPERLDDGTERDVYAERTRAFQALLANGSAGTSGGSSQSERYPLPSGESE
jgi:nicotinamide-nucleotide adenylyltransferase